MDSESGDLALARAQLRSIVRPTSGPCLLSGLRPHLEGSGHCGSAAQIWASPDHALSPIRLLAGCVTLGLCSAPLASVPSSVSSKAVCELHGLTV